MFKKMTLVLAVAVAGLTSMAATPQTASASDYGNGYSHRSHNCGYKTVLTYKYKQVPHKVKVVRYYPNGAPYYAWKTKWKTIKVPVYKKVLTNCRY